jgi:hypothetical protein
MDSPRRVLLGELVSQENASPRRVLPGETCTQEISPRRLILPGERFAQESSPGRLFLLGHFRRVLPREYFSSQLHIRVYAGSYVKTTTFSLSSCSWMRPVDHDQRELNGPDSCSPMWSAPRIASSRLLGAALTDSPLSTYSHFT